MLFYKLKKIWKPEMFQGGSKKEKYFEGWYYKLVDKKGNLPIAIIPGVSIDKKNKTSHSFIQLIEGASNNSHYLKFPLEEFRYSKEEFKISIGKNLFMKDKISLDIQKSENSNIRVEGSLRFKGVTPWPVKLLSPGIMGWYAFMPFMECYHGVVSLDHNIKGSLLINKSTIDYNGGKGYIEKDWGESFPQAWVWMQCNQFQNDKASLTASIAKIPWLNSEFTGFIIGLLYNNKLYKFTTYTGAKLKCLKVEGKNVKIIVMNKSYELQILGTMNEGTKLLSPNSGIMNGRVEESLVSNIEFSLYKIDERNKEGKELIIKDKGNNAGMEITKPDRL